LYKRIIIISEVLIVIAVTICILLEQYFYVSIIGLVSQVLVLYTLSDGSIRVRKALEYVASLHPDTEPRSSGRYSSVGSTRSSGLRSSGLRSSALRKHFTDSVSIDANEPRRNSSLKGGSSNLKIQNVITHENGVTIRTYSRNEAKPELSRQEYLLQKAHDIRIISNLLLVFYLLQFLCTVTIGIQSISYASHSASLETNMFGLFLPVVNLSNSIILACIGKYTFQIIDERKILPPKTRLQNKAKRPSGRTSSSRISLKITPNGKNIKRQNSNNFVDVTLKAKRNIDKDRVMPDNIDLTNVTRDQANVTRDQTSGSESSKSITNSRNSSAVSVTALAATPILDSAIND
jgi:hypothetical protein